jgi:NCS1 family nucleobase:cation symporter-1
LSRDFVELDRDVSKSLLWNPDHYWVLRKQRLHLAALFEVNGRYSYANGIHWKAIGVLAIAIAPGVPGFLRAATTPGGQVANPGVLDVLYTYAWFVTFALGFVLYWLFSTTRSGGIASPPDEQRTG